MTNDRCDWVIAASITERSQLGGFHIIATKHRWTFFFWNQATIGDITKKSALILTILSLQLVFTVLFFLFLFFASVSFFGQCGKHVKEVISHAHHLSRRVRWRNILHLNWGESSPNQFPTVTFHTLSFLSPSSFAQNNSLDFRKLSRVNWDKQTKHLNANKVTLTGIWGILHWMAAIIIGCLWRYLFLEVHKFPRAPFAPGKLFTSRNM